MIVDIALLNSCNFTCDYCISGSKYAEEAPFGRYEMRGAFIDPDALIEFINTHLRGSIVQLSGGEPLTYAPLSYVVKSIIDNVTVVINTNGALLSNVYKYLSDSVKWRVSIHPEQRHGDISALLRDVNKYIHGDVLYNYVIHPRHILNNRAEYALRIIDQLERCGCKFEVTGFTGKYKETNYKPIDPIYDGLTTEFPYQKHTEIMAIAPDGYIYPCHEYSSGVGSIGNIYLNDFNRYKVCDNVCFGPHNVSWCSTITSMIRLGVI